VDYYTKNSCSDINSLKPGAKTAPSNTGSSQNQENKTEEAAGGNASAPSEQMSPVPDEFRHLRLIGTASNVQNEQPYAVIENTRNNTQSLFKQGEQIDGATIVDIQSNGIVLSLNGKNFMLILEKSEPKDEQLSTDELLHEPPNPFIHSTPDDIENAWDETQNLMTQIELEQYLDKDEPNGVKVAKVSPGSVFEKIGFKPGDILVAVDDMKMSVANDAMEVYNCIRTKPEVKFTIIREGEPNPVILEYNSETMQK